MVCVLGTVVVIFTVLSLLSAKTGRQKPQSSASAHSRPVSFFTDVTPFYGHNIRPVHGAAVLQRGRCDAQLRIVPPGRQCAVECDVGNHLPRLDLHGDVKHLIGVGQHQFKGEVAGVALGVQQRDLRVRSSGDEVLSFNNSIFGAVTQSFGTNRHCYTL